MESGAEVDDLFGGDVCHDEFRSVGRRFHCSLAFAIPINGSTIDEMQDARECSASEPVMIQVGVSVGSGNNLGTIGHGGISGNHLVYVAVHSTLPIGHNVTFKVVLDVTCTVTNGSLMETLVSEVSVHSLEADT